jgi:hypothetical protein
LASSARTAGAAATDTTVVAAMTTSIDLMI